MRIAIVCVVLASALACAAAESGTVFASLAAPKGEDWLNPERWKDEQVEGKAVVRLVGGTSYARLKVTGEVPKAGRVMLRIQYHSSGKPFSAGIGAWASPTWTTGARPQGWQTQELVFPAARIGRFLKDGRISLLFTGGGPDGPAIARAELLVPTPEQAMAAFRLWVREGTADAWAASKTAQFTQLKSDEPPAELAPTPADSARGAVPMVRSYLSFIYPDSVPKEPERTLSGRIVMTPGEYEPFQFALRALKDFGQLSAEVVGGTPKGLDVDLRWVECAPVRNGGSRSTKFRVQPNRLWPREVFPTCAVKAGQTQAWWAIVKAADELEAKTYPVKIAVKDAGKPVAEFALDVTVLPFRLPKQTGRSFLMTPSNLVDDEDILAELAEHGQNGISAFNEFQPVSDGKVDFGVWDAYFASLKRHGIASAFFWYLGNPRSGNSVKAGVGQEKFLEILKAIHQRVSDGRYPKLFCLSIDEAVRSGKAFAESKELYQMLKEHAPSLKVLGCSLDRYSDTVKYEGRADVLACNGSFAQNSAWCKEKGVLLNTYSFVCAGMTSSHTRLNYGFAAYQYGSAAVNGWAMCWYNGHPFNDLDAGITDWGIFLPNWAGPSTSTPSWEGFREGVDDMRYAAVLEGLVKEGKSDGKVLEEIRANGVGKMMEMKEKVVGDSVFGASLRDAHALDIARARLIQEILKATGRSPRPWGAQ